MNVLEIYAKCLFLSLFMAQLPSAAWAQPDSYDTDGDGLIEVASLGMLNAIHYDLDANGKPDTSANDNAYKMAFGRTTLPSGAYMGYELMADLDFSGSRWAEGAAEPDAITGGWKPIGHAGKDRDLDRPFTGTFSGNGHVISNMYIYQPALGQIYEVGLFGYVKGGVIRNVGLERVRVTGQDVVGGLVGAAEGSTITACYVTGDVTANGAFSGGLVGWIVRNDTVVVASYFIGSVTGDSRTGGLVGLAQDGNRLVANYVIGSVTGDLRVGGLVGGTISGPVSAAANYAVVDVVGTEEVGGLVGDNANSLEEVATNYYDSEATTVTGLYKNTAGAQPTASLQGTLSFADVYAGWDVGIDGHAAAGDAVVWDLGMADEYPALRVDFNGDGTATVEEFGSQRSGNSDDGDINDVGSGDGGARASIISGREVSLTISPNPVREWLHIRGATSQYHASLHALGGRLVRQAVLEVGEAWDVRAIAPGVYILRIERGDVVSHIRLVKE